MTSNRSDEKHLYLLHGSDRTGIHSRRDALIANFKEMYTHVDVLTFNSLDTDLKDYLADMQSPTLFGGFRLFLIPHLQDFTVDECRRIGAYLQSPPAGGAVILEYEESGKNRKKNTSPLKILDIDRKMPGMAVERFHEPKEYEMVSWLQQRARKSFSLTVEADAARHLCEYCGYSPEKIAGELTKIDTLLMDNRSVTLDTVKRICGDDVVVDALDFVHLVGFRDWNAVRPALTAAGRNSSNSVIYFSTVLFYHIHTLYKVRLYAAQHRSEANRYFRASYKEKNSIAGDIAVQAGLITEKQRNRVYPMVVKRGLIDQAGKFTPQELRRAICKIAAYDRAVKSGTDRADFASFAELCYAIICPKKV
ncbi:MAG: DNA polymerase III subunit delta [Fibrobacterota bacterium]